MYLLGSFEIGLSSMTLSIRTIIFRSNKICPLSVCAAGQGQDKGVQTFGVFVRRRDRNEKFAIFNPLRIVCDFLMTVSFSVVTGSSSYLKSDVISDKPVIVGDLVSTAWFRHYKL